MLEAKKRSFFTLASGRPFYPFNPKPESIFIEDIARALSNLCRFNGHCHKFYSVAEHSVWASEIVSPENKLQALLHDATEAYVGDLIRPIKKFTPDFVLMEELVWDAICTKFGVPKEMHYEVKWADDACLKAEGRDLLQPFGVEKFPDIRVTPPPSLVIWRQASAEEPLLISREPWTPEEARIRFLERFHSLTNRGLND